MNTRNVWVAGLVLALSTSALAAKAPAKDAKATKDTETVYLKKVEQGAPIIAIKAPDVKLEDLQKVVADSEKRRPAGAANENGMSPELRAIRDRFLALKSSDELAALISELDKNYDNLPVDAKVLTAQVVPAQALRGIIFKVRDVFERRSRAAHSAALTLAKNITTNFRIYLPQESMKVVHEYFTSPYYDKGTLVKDFDSEADIQRVLAGDFANEVYRADQRLEKLDLNKPVVWDQRFSYGPESFQDGLNRFRFVGELEKSLIRSAMMATYAQLAVLRAYNINDTIDLSADIGRLYGIDGFISAVDGVSAAKITSQIRRRPKVGTPLPDAQEALTSALNASRWSTIHAMAAWNASAKPRQDESLYGIDTGYWRVNRNDVEKNLNIAYRVVNSNGPEKIRSAVTGEVIEINYAAFFRPFNLQTLLPTKFVKQALVSRQAATSVEGGSQASISYRNYADGSPEGWNVAAYRTFVPSVKSDEDVFRTMRVLSHAGGSWLNIVR